MEHQLDATITVLLISKINKTVIVASSWFSIFTLPTLMMHGQTQIKFRMIIVDKNETCNLCSSHTFCKLYGIQDK
jgi:hypothetical protein